MSRGGRVWDRASRGCVSMMVVSTGLVVPHSAVKVLIAASGFPGTVVMMMAHDARSRLGSIGLVSLLHVDRYSRACAHRRFDRFNSSG